MVSSLVFMRWIRLGPNRSLYAVRALIVAVIVLWATAAGGCAAGGRAPGVAGVSMPVEGRWDDVEAAVEYSAPRNGLAVVRAWFEPVGASGSEEAQAVVYELLSVLDRRVLLRASQGERIEAGVWGVDRIEVQWRPFRDERLEREFAAAVRDRLEVLRLK